MRKPSTGFTLIELILVIVVLGIVSTVTLSYLGLGARMYADAADREELLTSSRFVVERLTRELRNVVPNSVRILNNGYCIEFAPMLAAGRYDSSLSSDSATLYSPAGWDKLVNTIAASSVQNYMTVYPTDADADIYNKGKIAAFGSGVSFDHTTGSSTITVNFGSPVNSLTSASQRMYFLSAPVVYCVDGDSVFRFQRSEIVPSMDMSTLTNGVQMASKINSGFYTSVAPFKYQESVVLTRNSVVQIYLAFKSDLNDTLVFNQEIHIPNVP